MVHVGWVIMKHNIHFVGVKQINQHQQVWALVDLKHINWDSRRVIEIWGRYNREHTDCNICGFDYRIADRKVKYIRKQFAKKVKNGYQSIVPQKIDLEIRQKIDNVILFEMLKL